MTAIPRGAVAAFLLRAGAVDGILHANQGRPAVHTAALL